MDVAIHMVGHLCIRNIDPPMETSPLYPGTVDDVRYFSSFEAVHIERGIAHGEASLGRS